MKIIDWNALKAEEKKKVLERPSENNAILAATVLEIIHQVRREGDRSLFALTRQYDQAILENLTVSEQEFTKATTQVCLADRKAIQEAMHRISHYQQALFPERRLVDTQDGVYCERRPVPIERVGFYVPGGTAPLVSTLLMLAIPAKIAGCAMKVLCTPPNCRGEIDPRLLVAAQYCGVETVFKVGGVQAIAAMAFGTESITKVDKLYGPGNTWVTAAKKAVAQEVGGAAIDLPAGPSELMVIADKAANPDFLAADLLSQAEHGADSQVILLSDSRAILEETVQSLRVQQSQLIRKKVLQQSLQYARIILLENIAQAIQISNDYAPEHLILQLHQADQWVARIKNAGAVFVGEWSVETLGDYVTGANHVLPTSGYARCYSGLSVVDFMKFISIQTVSPRGLKKLSGAAIALAEIEGLDAHKNAIQVRLKQ